MKVVTEILQDLEILKRLLKHNANLKIRINYYLTGTPKDKEYSLLSSKLELKGLVKPETASSTRSTLHLSRLNTFLFHFSALKSCFTILSSDVMSNTPFHL